MAACLAGATRFGCVHTGAGAGVSACTGVGVGAGVSGIRRGSGLLRRDHHLPKPRDDVILLWLRSTLTIITITITITSIITPNSF